MSKADPIAQEHRQRNEAREPKDHRHGLNAQDGELVMRDRLGEAPWHDDEVQEREDRPDRAEDKVVDLRGRGVVPVAGPPVGDYRHKTVSDGVHDVGDYTYRRLSSPAR